MESKLEKNINKNICLSTGTKKYKTSTIFKNSGNYLSKRLLNKTRNKNKLEELH